MLKEKLTEAGFLLAPTSNRIIIIGKNIQGTHHDTVPNVEIVSIDGNTPVYQAVILTSSGYCPFDGVSVIAD